MPDTFGGTWTRPANPQRGHSRRELADLASYDNQPKTSCLGCLTFALITTTAIAAAAVRGRK